jgi:U3 small nucleolar RNA-associated protein 21
MGGLNKKLKSTEIVKSASKIFEPFRALGYVSGNVPFVVQTKGTSFYVTCSIGNSFHIYNVFCVSSSVISCS